MSEPETTANVTETLQHLLDSLSEATGGSQAEILREWDTALAAVAQIRTRLESASNPKDLETVIEEAIKSYNSDIAWLMEASKATHAFIGAQVNLESARSRLDQLRWNRQADVMANSLLQTKAPPGVVEALRRTKVPVDLLASVHRGIGFRQLRALESSWSTAIRAEWRVTWRLGFYRYRRLVVRVMFGVLLLGCLTFAIGTAFPAWYVAAGLSLFGGLLQEFWLSPWLTRLLSTGLRNDLRSVLNALALAKLVASAHMILWSNEMQSADKAAADDPTAG